MAGFAWKKEVKILIKILFGVVFLIGLLTIIAIITVKSCSVFMDDSFRWGGRDGNGL